MQTRREQTDGHAPAGSRFGLTAASSFRSCAISSAVRRGQAPETAPPGCAAAAAAAAAPAAAAAAEGAAMARWTVVSAGGLAVSVAMMASVRPLPLLLLLVAAWRSAAWAAPADVVNTTDYTYWCVVCELPARSAPADTVCTGTNGERSMFMSAPCMHACVHRKRVHSIGCVTVGGCTCAHVCARPLFSECGCTQCAGHVRRGRIAIAH